MMPLLKMAECHGISVEYFDFDDCFDGLYIRIENKRPLILLHKNLQGNSTLARCILAEELGHYLTTVGNTLHQHKNYGNFLRTNKIEKAALKKAGHLLISNDELIEFIKNNKHDPRTLAENFNVTLEFMVIRLKVFAEEHETAHGGLFRRIHAKETTRQLAGSFSTI